MHEYNILNENFEIVLTIHANQVRFDGTLIFFCEDEYSVDTIFNLPPGWMVAIPKDTNG